MNNIQNKIKVLILLIVLILFTSCVQRTYHMTNKTENISTLEVRMEELRSLLQNYEHTDIDIKNISISIQNDTINISFQNNILFDLDKYTVKEKYKDVLNVISNYLLENSTLEVTIEGYTDSSGKEDYNLKLSKKRAISVKNILVEFSVDSNRIDTIGYGEEYWLYDNNTKEGRRKNRRAEILIRESIEKIPTISKSSYSDTNNNSVESNSFTNNLSPKFKAYAACASLVGSCKIASHKFKGAFKEQGIAHSCALIEKKMQGKNYTIPDMIKTTFLTVINSAADKLMKSDSDSDISWGKAGKGIIYYEKLKAFNECTESMEEQYSAN